MTFRGFFFTEATILSVALGKTGSIIFALFMDVNFGIIFGAFFDFVVMELK